jgi:hypothetical protein
LNEEGSIKNVSFLGHQGFAWGDIYYLPGYGGQLAIGLGQGLMDRGFDVTGRETRGGFRDLPISGTSVRKRILAWTLTPVSSIRLSAP